jgi:hypothetical protein
VRQLKANPDGDIGQMLAQMLKVVAHNTQENLLEAGAEPTEIALMARALKDLTSVEEQKLAIEARAAAAATAAAAKSAADAVDRVGRTLKLDEAVLKRIREEVYGITPTPAPAA